MPAYYEDNMLHKTFMNVRYRIKTQIFNLVFKALYHFSAILKCNFMPAYYEDNILYEMRVNVRYRRKK